MKVNKNKIIKRKGNRIHYNMIEYYIILCNIIFFLIFFNEEINNNLIIKIIKR